MICSGLNTLLPKVCKSEIQVGREENGSGADTADAAKDKRFLQ